MIMVSKNKFRVTAKLIFFVCFYSVVIGSGEDMPKKVVAPELFSISIFDNKKNLTSKKFSLKCKI